jgi:hypothetical protein
MRGAAEAQDEDGVKRKALWELSNKLLNEALSAPSGDVVPDK